MSVKNVQRIGLASLFAMLAICAAAVLLTRPAHGQNYAWDTGKWAGSTDLRGKGPVLVDSLRTAGTVTARTITADTQVVTGCQYSVYARDAAQANITGGIFANGQIAAFAGIDGVSGYGTITNFSRMTITKIVADSIAVDTLGVGGGASIVKADTSAAGDSLKATYLNGKKGMLFQTEVGP
jgi:hypothetical protein